MNDQEKIINGIAEIKEMNAGLVIFRFYIDVAEPEFTDIKLTRKRWEKLDRPTELHIRIMAP